MLVLHWYAVGVFATVLTFAWLFVERRITTTSGLAFGMWSFLAVTAGTLTTRTDCGLTVAAGDAMLQWFTAAMALLSLLAFVLYRMGLYPPEREEMQEDANV